MARSQQMEDMDLDTTDSYNCVNTQSATMK